MTPDDWEIKKWQAILLDILGVIMLIAWAVSTAYLICKQSHKI